MDITVIICTFNRCKSLSATLDSVALQLLPESVTWEALVVDNNSSDRTQEVVESYCRRCPGLFRYVFEPQQGLSRARNAGIRAAQGEIIVFTDDDVIAEPCWVENLTAPLRTVKWSGSGGRVAPPPDLELPNWLIMGGDRDLVGVLLPIFDLGKQGGEMKRPPYGANMAFRKTMFEKYGLFRVDLGHSGEKLLSGEDIEFGRRLMASGERLYYEPSSVVHHPVPDERLTKRYFRAWWFDFGRTRIIERSARPPIFGIPRHFLSLANLVLRFLPIRTLRWLFSSNAKQRFYNECQIRLALGELAETWKRHVRSQSISHEFSLNSQGKP